MKIFYKLFAVSWIIMGIASIVCLFITNNDEAKVHLVIIAICGLVFGFKWLLFDIPEIN